MQQPLGCYETWMTTRGGWELAINSFHRRLFTTSTLGYEYLLWSASQLMLEYVYIHDWLLQTPAVWCLASIVVLQQHRSISKKSKLFDCTLDKRRCAAASGVVTLSGTWKATRGGWELAINCYPSRLFTTSIMDTFFGLHLQFCLELTLEICFFEPGLVTLTTPTH